MDSRIFEAPEGADIATKLVERLAELFRRSDDVHPLMNQGVLDIILELNQHREDALDELEALTIITSKLRYQTAALPQQQAKEMKAAVHAVRRTSANAISNLSRDVTRVRNERKLVENKHGELLNKKEEYAQQLREQKQARTELVTLLNTALGDRADLHLKHSEQQLEIDKLLLMIRSVERRMAETKSQEKARREEAEAMHSLLADGTSETERRLREQEIKNLSHDKKLAAIKESLRIVKKETEEMNIAKMNIQRESQGLLEVEAEFQQQSQSIMNQTKAQVQEEKRVETELEQAIKRHKDEIKELKVYQERHKEKIIQEQKLAEKAHETERELKRAFKQAKIHQEEAKHVCNALTSRAEEAQLQMKQMSQKVADILAENQEIEAERITLDDDHGATMDAEKQKLNNFRRETKELVRQHGLKMNLLNELLRQYKHTKEQFEEQSGAMQSKLDSVLSNNERMQKETEASQSQYAAQLKRLGYLKAKHKEIVQTTATEKVRDAKTLAAMKEKLESLKTQKVTLAESKTIAEEPIPGLEAKLTECRGTTAQADTVFKEMRKSELSLEETYSRGQNELTKQLVPHDRAVKELAEFRKEKSAREAEEAEKRQELQANVDVVCARQKMVAEFNRRLVDGQRELDVEILPVTQKCQKSKVLESQLHDDIAVLQAKISEACEQVEKQHVEAIENEAYWSATLVEHARQTHRISSDVQICGSVMSASVQRATTNVASLLDKQRKTMR